MNWRKAHKRARRAMLLDQVRGTIFRVQFATSPRGWAERIEQNWFSPPVELLPPMSVTCLEMIDAMLKYAQARIRNEIAVAMIVADALMGAK